MLLIRAVDNHVIHIPSILLHKVYWFSVKPSQATSLVWWLSTERGSFYSIIIILVTSSLMARIMMIFKTLVCSPFNLLTWLVVWESFIELGNHKASGYMFTDFDITYKIGRAIKHVLLEVLPKLPCVPIHLTKVHFIYHKFSYMQY